MAEGGGMVLNFRLMTGQTLALSLKSSLTGRPLGPVSAATVGLIATPTVAAALTGDRCCGQEATVREIKEEVKEDVNLLPEMQQLYHEGALLRDGTKHAIRTDVMFRPG